MIFMRNYSNLSPLPKAALTAFIAFVVVIAGEFLVARVSDIAAESISPAHEALNLDVKAPPSLRPKGQVFGGNECVVGACSSTLPEQMLPIIYDSVRGTGATPSDVSFSPMPAQSISAGSYQVFKVAFSMNGSYSSIQETVGALLSRHANFALDDVQLTRPDASSSMMTAHLTLSAFLPTSSY